MDRPYIERLHIQNYGCIQDATFALTPLHALIGPNDSGKSTVLRALRTLTFLIAERSTSQETEALSRAILGTKTKVTTALAASTATWTFQFFSQEHGNYEVSSIDRLGSVTNKIGFSIHPGHWPGLRGTTPELKRALGGSQILRLDPDALRAPNALIPQENPLHFLDERGTGLAALYDAIMVRDLPAFLRLNEELSQIFPNVKSISLINPTPTKKAMGVKLVDGTYVPAELMSEGLLYYLAFAALPHLDPKAILLIEEPENGLHPARISEVMRVLREISKTTQVLIATHSPLVINELQGDEVTVVTRSREHGTKATLMKDTPNFEERSKVYALGELWVSYANGEDEAPLLQGGPRP